MSRRPGRKPFARRAPVARPPAVPRAEPVRIPPIVSPSMTPEQLEQAKAYATDRPLPGVGRIPSTEPPIRDPQRLAEIRAQWLRENEGPSAPPSSGNSSGL
jgi:hypothetical protein